MYLSKRIVKLAFSDWYRLLSIQLATYLKKNTERLLIKHQAGKAEIHVLKSFPLQHSLVQYFRDTLSGFILFLKWQIF